LAVWKAADSFSILWDCVLTFEEGYAMTETPQDYIARMLGNLEGQDARKVQAATPQKLERLIRGVAASKLRTRPAPGKWSVGEIVAHMADTEIVASWRMRAILGAPGTTIQAFDQDTWAEAGHYAKRDARKCMAQFRALREVNLALFKTLTPEQWKQHGMHAERGEESIEHIVRMMAGHDVNHLGQIERIVSQRKARSGRGRKR
jgi:uncharacterized damage-inducible protein DinB